MGHQYFFRTCISDMNVQMGENPQSRASANPAQDNSEVCRFLKCAKFQITEFTFLQLMLAQPGKEEKWQMVR